MSEAQWPRSSADQVGPVAAARLAGVAQTVLLRALRRGELQPDDGVLRRRDVASWGERLRCSNEAAPSDAELAALYGNGFLHVRSAVAPATVRAVRRQSARTVAACEPPDERLIYVDGKSGALDRIVRLHEFIPSICEAVLAAGPLLRLSDRLFDRPYGIYGVSLVMSEPGRGLGMGMHRDPTWSTRLRGDPVVALGLHLDAADAANGAVGFFPGTHLSAEDPPEEPPSGCTEVVPVTTAGDVVVHNLGVWHRSRPNTGTGPRWVIYYALMSEREASASGRRLVVVRRPGTQPAR